MRCAGGEAQSVRNSELQMAEVQPGVPLQKCATEAWRHSKARPLETATLKFHCRVRRQRLI